VKAIILAGGLGTRLRPLTTTCPKPLLPVGNLPLLVRIIHSLRKQEIRDFLFLLHYQPEQFKNALGNGEEFDAHFEYVAIDKDLGTAGSVKYLGAHIRETSLIYSADILAEVPVQRMLDFHYLKKALVTIALYPMPAPLAFGIVLRRSDGSIARFLEKPSWPQVFSDWINSAIYIIEPELLEHIPHPGAFTMFEKEVFPPLAAARARIFGFPLYGYWRDVGTPEDLRLANIDFIHGNLPFAMLTPAEEERMRRTSTAESSHDLWRGENTAIAAGACIEETLVGKNCRIAAGAHISRSVILDDVEIGEHARIQGAIIMNGARVGAGAQLHEDCLIGAGARLGEVAVLHKNAAVKPNGRIANLRVITPQKVMPTGYLRRFVDGGNLLGAPHDSFNSEFLHWVGKAFAAQQNTKPGAAHPMLLATANREVFAESFHALAQGLSASGFAVHLLSDVTVPITRKKLRDGQYAGALYLGWEDFSGLLRVVLLHPDGENFSILETCALERAELPEETLRGEQLELETAPVRLAYLEAMAALLPRIIAPKRLLIGVVGKATEALARQFFERFDLPASLLNLPQEANAGFKHKVKSFQKTLVRHYEDGYDFVFWMGSVGERMRLLLPAHDATNFGVSDIVLAQLLSKRWIKPWPIVNGWLMPDLKAHRQEDLPEEPAPIVTGMNSSMAKLAQRCRFKKWYGFDGMGGVTVSEWMNYHDAWMALAHILPLVAEKKVHKLAHAAENLSTRYHLLACPDEAKAQVIRRLIESCDDHVCEVNDGVKIKGESGWVVVRLCAGRPALEIFTCTWKKEEDEIEILFGRVLRNLEDWIEKIAGKKNN